MLANEIYSSKRLRNKEIRYFFDFVRDSASSGVYFACKGSAGSSPPISTRKRADFTRLFPAIPSTCSRSTGRATKCADPDL
jgi:hypothetical protein